MRGGEIGHTPSTVLDACVTQRAKHALGWGWGAIRITGRDSDARIVAGRNLDAACILGRDADARTVIGRDSDAARIAGRDSDARRALSVQKSPENARNVRISPENAGGARTSPDKANVVRISPENAGTAPKPSHKRTRKHARGRTYPYVLSYSIHHTKRRDTSAHGEQP